MLLFYILAALVLAPDECIYLPTTGTLVLQTPRGESYEIDFTQVIKA